MRMESSTTAAANKRNHKYVHDGWTGGTEKELKRSYFSFTRSRGTYRAYIKGMSQMLQSRPYLDLLLVHHTWESPTVVTFSICSGMDGGIDNCTT